MLEFRETKENVLGMFILVVKFSQLNQMWCSKCIR